MSGSISTKKDTRSRIIQMFRIFFKILRIMIFVAMAILVVAGCIVLYKAWPVLKDFWEEADQLVSASDADTFRLDETSYIFAGDGSCITKLVGDADCEYVEYSDLPQGVLDAFIAIEDKRFYQHRGVDWMSTIKAAVQYVLFRDSSRGGSTITQQLARNVFADIGFTKSYQRKIREIFTAVCLERRYSKKQILEFYVNNINYSNGYYGIGSAAHGYFNKKVSKLTDAEVALLCAIPNNPTYYNPRKQLQHVLYRRNLILAEMAAQGYLTEEEYLKSVNSAVKIKKQKNVFYNYESSYAIHCIVEFLMQADGFAFRYTFEDMDDYSSYRSEYEEAFAFSKAKLCSRGYRIYTSIDLDVQRAVQDCGDTALQGFSGTDSSGVYNTQFAAVVVDNRSGLVTAAVGGRTQEELKNVYSLNRAYQSYKQPGSTIKPLAVYTPSLEKGYTPDTIVHDVYDPNGPKNAGDTYLGDITFRTAVEKSKNTVAWGLMRELTPQGGLHYLQKMRFDRITPNDYYLPASLGGLYYGVTAVQMASAYSALCNLGKYRSPSCITAVITSDGRDIYRAPKPVRVYSKDAASVMTDILSGVHESGTAAGLFLPDNEEMPIACKTGTTNDSKCAWFCGYTPYYTCAVYVGNDDNMPIQDLYGATYPMYIWRDIQNILCSGKKIIPFKTYEKSVESRKPGGVEVDEAHSAQTVVDELTPDVSTAPADSNLGTSPSVSSDQSTVRTESEVQQSENDDALDNETGQEVSESERIGLEQSSLEQLGGSEQSDTEQPSEPEQTEQPVGSEQFGESEQTEQPAESEQFGESEQPDELVQSGETEQSEQSDQSDLPESDWPVLPKISESEQAESDGS